MKIADFELYKGLLYENSGLVLTPDQSYVLNSRLTPVARKWNYPSLSIMTLQLRAIPDADLVRDIVEAMTSGETSFFRDAATYQALAETLLPTLVKTKSGKKQLRIWSTGCSSGQEPYSIAMLLKDQDALFKGWKTEITATDISQDLLASARAGFYTQFEIQRGLTVTQLLRYFEQSGTGWQVTAEIRKMVRYGTFNLLDSPAKLGRFEVIFCRNVLSGFDEGTSIDVLDYLHGVLEKDGLLVVGAGEDLTALSDKFVKLPDAPGLYIRR